MKIAIPILDFSKGGGARVLSKLASEWTMMGHSVFFLVNNRNVAPYFPTQAKIVRLGDNGMEVERDNLNNPTYNDTGGLQYVFHNLYTLLKGLNNYAHDCDIILANHSLTAWPVSLSNSKAKKFYYIQAYEPDLGSDKILIKSILWRIVTIPSYYFKLKRIVNSPIYFSYKSIKSDSLVPPGIDLSIFYSKRGLDKNWDNRKIILGCIGRKEPWKGTIDVLEASLIMINRKYNIELHVAFGDPIKEKLQFPHCKIITSNNDFELSEFYRNIDILIAPALGLGQLGCYHYPVMEAMACGTPAIHSGFLPGTKNNSWIVPIHDRDAIADSVHEIINNVAVRNLKIQQGLQDVKEYAWENVAKEMIEIFELCPSKT